MSDDLVERVATVLYGGHTQDHSWEHTARAAIAVLRPAIRAEAFEEAAKVAEQCAPVSQDTWSTELAERCDMVAAAIRALIK